MRVTLISIFALVACAEQGDEGMYVLNNTAVTDKCVLTGTTSQPFMSHGEIYAFGDQGYFLTPLIQSRLVSPEGVDPIQNTIQLRSANIELTLKAVTVGLTNTQPDTSLGSLTALFSGALPPSGSVNVGFELIPLSILSNVVINAGDPNTASIRAEILASVTIIGDINGNEVTSSPFVYPVTACNDCIVRVYVDSTGTPLTCPVPNTLSPSTGNACNHWQDGVVDCCRDGAGALVCPATTAAI